MYVLCFDIGSGGLTAGCFDERLETVATHEIAWQFHRDAAGVVTLSAEEITGAIEQLVPMVARDVRLAGVSAGCFMHSHLVLSSCCAPLTPISTWMDVTGAQGMDSVKSVLADRLHRETGCRYHPMFPLFKLAANPPGQGNRVASPKAFLIQELTNIFADDVGTASASGLLDLHTGGWHTAILDLLKLVPSDLPVLANPDEVAGTVTDPASKRFSIPAGTPVVLGSGDGFLANIGSGCTSAERVSVTLGTSGVARQILPAPVVEERAGTFCYRASRNQFLFGCASSNGGNVLEWGGRLFGEMAESDESVPLFLPWLHGERSFEWNPNMTGSFHGLKGLHEAPAMSRAVAEGVLFNLAQYVERLTGLSGARQPEVVLSGNGFLAPQLSSILAGVINGNVLMPRDPGLAGLRGAAVTAWKALGHDATPRLEELLRQTKPVRPLKSSAMADRYARFKELRGRSG